MFLLRSHKVPFRNARLQSIVSQVKFGSWQDITGIAAGTSNARRFCTQSFHNLTRLVRVNIKQA